MNKEIVKGCEIVSENGFNDFSKLYADDPALAVKYYRVALRRNKPFRVKKLTYIDSEKKAIAYKKEFLAINKNGKIYRWEALEEEVRLMYKKKKVYARRNRRGITQVSIKGIRHHGEYKFVPYSEILECIDKRLRFLSDYEAGKWIGDISLTAIKKNKLYSIEKILKHIYPFVNKSFLMASFHAAKEREGFGQSNPNRVDFASEMSELNEMLLLTKNPGFFFQTVTKPIYQPVKAFCEYRNLWEKGDFDDDPFAESVDISMFKDTLTMAWILGEKINLTWSFKRLKKEHDRMQKGINQVLLMGKDRPIKMKECFKDVEGMELIETTGRLLVEANTMKNCVASYLPRIENNHCALYHMEHKGEEHTVEVKLPAYGIKLIPGEIKRRNNQEPLNGIKKKVAKLLEPVNQKIVADKIVVDNNQPGLPF